MSLAELKQKIKQLKPDLKHHSIQYPISYQEGFFDCANKILVLLDEEFEKAVTKATMTHASKAWQEMKKTHIIIEKEKLRKLLQQRPYKNLPHWTKLQSGAIREYEKFLELLEKELGLK